MRSHYFPTPPSPNLCNQGRHGKKSEGKGYQPGCDTLYHPFIVYGAIRNSSYTNGIRYKWDIDAMSWVGMVSSWDNGQVVDLF
jgi:hypothetical protein